MEVLADSVAAASAGGRAIDLQAAGRASDAFRLERLRRHLGNPTVTHLGTLPQSEPADAVDRHHYLQLCPLSPTVTGRLALLRAKECVRGDGFQSTKMHARASLAPLGMLYRAVARTHARVC